MLIEGNDRFTCEIDPDHFSSEDICFGDYGIWCENCPSSDDCGKCKTNNCIGKGGCLLIEEDEIFTCEIDPSYFTSKDICDKDHGIWCGNCPSS